MAQSQVKMPKLVKYTDMQIPGVDIANFSFMDLGAGTTLGDLVIDANVDVNKDDDFTLLRYWKW